MLIVLTGPGSSGKDTIQARILEKFPNLQKVITTTSREQREKEVDGRDYHFLSREQFEKGLKNGDFIEFVDFAGNYYGTTKAALAPLVEGKDLVWRIETSRAAQIRELLETSFDPETARKLLQNTLIIYINVPDWEVLRQRMRKRGDADEEIERRLDQDQRDWQMYGQKFNHVVMNKEGQLDQAVAEVIRLIKAKTKNS